MNGSVSSSRSPRSQDQLTYPSNTAPAALSRQPLIPRRGTLAIGVTLFVVLLLNCYSPARPTLTERVLASVTICAACVPLWISAFGRNQMAPIFAIVCMFYVIYAGVPMFVLTHYSRAWFVPEFIPDSGMQLASGLSLAGVVCMLCGFYCPMSCAIARLTPKLRFAWRDAGSLSRAGASLVPIGISVMLIGYKYMRFEGNKSLPAGVQQLFYFCTQTAYLGGAILYYQWERGSLSQGYGVFLWLIVVPLIVLIGASTGALAPALNLGLLFVLIRTMLRRRVPWALFLGGLSVFVILNPIKTAFRQTVGRSESSQDVSPIARLVLMGDLLKQEASGGLGSAQEFISIGMDRMNILTTFADVTTLTPGIVPYWRGHTYYPLLTKVIPRTIYPGKPADDAVEGFSRRYGFVPKRRRDNSI